MLTGIDPRRSSIYRTSFGGMSSMYKYRQSPCQPKWQRISAGLCMLLVFAIGCIQARAQATQGSIIGTVRDPNGSVVPNAVVTLTNTGEGTERTARTSTVGDYQFLDV